MQKSRKSALFNPSNLPNPNGGFASVCLLLTPAIAHATTCDAGYYLNDGTCTICNPNNEAYYCPGDNMRHPCPTTNTDYNQFGYRRLENAESPYGSVMATSPSHCRCSIAFSDEYGNRFRLESPFNGENYWGDNFMWYSAGNGFYLSPYRNTTWKNWYDGIKACTNAPGNAHYIGAGTPDEPRAGGATDYNDCPWECDAGYELGDNDTCAPSYCTAGITQIRTGDISIPLFAVPQSVPAINVQMPDGAICYGTLATGAMDGTINIKFDETIYHAVK